MSGTPYCRVIGREVRLQEQVILPVFAAQAGQVRVQPPPALCVLVEILREVAQVEIESKVDSSSS
jgi:hypothetical protein